MTLEQLKLLQYVFMMREEDCWSPWAVALRIVD